MILLVIQRELILVSYPFSSLKTSKVRPAVVISNNGYNREFEDMIIVPITSNLSFRKHVIKLTGSELESGHLITDSVIKVDRVLSLKQNLTIKPIGKVKTEVLKKIIKTITEIISN